MKATRVLTQRRWPAMCLAAVVLAAAPIARVQTAGGDGSDGGIKVHGHWVMQVLNADGTLAQRREFDNALTPNGAAVIAQVLARTKGVARWTIELGGFTAGPCAGGTYGLFFSPNNSCFITDRNATALPTPATAVFPTLTSGIGGPNSDQIILSGNATALAAGQIEYVATVQGLCANTIAGCTLPAYINPAAGVTAGQRFTSHDLRDNQGVLMPVLVTAGQIVQVTVTISFCNSTGCL